jgi:hypothetical protein
MVLWADGSTTEEEITCLCFFSGQSLWILHLGPQVASQPPETYPPWDVFMTSPWLEPEIVWPAAGHTAPGVEITVDFHEPDAGFDPDSGAEEIGGDGGDDPPLVGAGARSGAAGLGWAPGEATGGGAASRTTDETGVGSGRFPCSGWESGTFEVGGAASAGEPAFRAGTPAESTCGLTPARSTVSSRNGG